MSLAQSYSQKEKDDLNFLKKDSNIYDPAVSPTKKPDQENLYSFHHRESFGNRSGANSACQKQSDDKLLLLHELEQNTSYNCNNQTSYMMESYYCCDSDSEVDFPILDDENQKVYE